MCEGKGEGGWANLEGLVGILELVDAAGDEDDVCAFGGELLCCGET